MFYGSGKNSGHKVQDEGVPKPQAHLTPNLEKVIREPCNL